ncbi:MULTISPECIES: hypothetical protein [unclassified Modestobacter]
MVLTRLQRDERTRAYADCRRARGKTDREIKCCLKRYIVRELHRRLESPPVVRASGGVPTPSAAGGPERSLKVAD